MNLEIKKTIKVFSLIVIAILIIGFFVFIATSGNAKQEPTEDQNNSAQKTEEKEVDDKSLITIFLILISVVIGVFAYSKNSAKFQNIFNDDKTKDYARKYLIEKHNFPLQNKIGSVHYYYPYYSAGNKNLPRAIVCFNLKSDRTNTEPHLSEIITVDINRKDPERDTALLPPMNFETMMKFVHDIKLGKTGESISPVKQQRQVFSEIEMDAIEESRKEEIKEALKI